MATAYLIGDGAMGTPANWATGGACPAAGDTAIVGGLCAADATDTGSVCDADQAVWDIQRTYTHSFGTSAAPIAVAAALIKIYSSGPVFMECAATLNVDECRVAMARPDCVCELGSATGAAGEWVKLFANRGKITLKANIDLTAAEVHIGYISNPASDVNLTIATSAPTLPLLSMNGGRCTAGNVITTALVANGTMTKTTAKITTAYVLPGGVLNYEYASVAGDNTTIYVYGGGLLDLMTNEVYKDIDNVIVFSGGLVRYDPSIHTFSGSAGLINVPEKYRFEVLP